MRFVVDNQLPPRLSRFLADAGHDAVHVTMVGLDAADDQSVWAWAIREARVLVSKDEDFLSPCSRLESMTGRLTAAVPGGHRASRRCAETPGTRFGGGLVA